LLNDRFDQISQTYPRLSEFDIYIDGSESLTNKTTQFLHNAGVDEKNIITRFAR
jgi:hypothetical protein